MKKLLTIAILAAAAVAVPLVVAQNAATPQQGGQADKAQAEADAKAKRRAQANAEMKAQGQPRSRKRKKRRGRRSNSSALRSPCRKGFAPRRPAQRGVSFG